MPIMQPYLHTIPTHTHNTCIHTLLHTPTHYKKCTTDIELSTYNRNTIILYKALISRVSNNKIS